jgi:hypothetical protein
MRIDSAAVAGLTAEFVNAVEYHEIAGWFPSIGQDVGFDGLTGGEGAEWVRSHGTKR